MICAGVLDGKQDTCSSVCIRLQESEKCVQRRDVLKVC